MNGPARPNVPEGGGVGLGLSTAGTTLEPRGGTATIESVEGKGTEVTLRIREPGAKEAGLSVR